MKRSSLLLFLFCLISLLELSSCAREPLDAMHSRNYWTTRNRYGQRGHRYYYPYYNSENRRHRSSGF